MKVQVTVVKDGSTRMLHPAVAEVLKKKGVVRDYETAALASKPEVTPAAPSIEEAEPAVTPRTQHSPRAKKKPTNPTEAPRARRTYQRRDLKAEA